jgi:murein DD-endopeptidase MepM/ murein hydrolase activator NlpD
MKVKRLKKLLLIAVIGLFNVFLLEAGQGIVRAIELSPSLISANLTISANSTQSAVQTSVPSPTQGTLQAFPNVAPKLQAPTARSTTQSQSRSAVQQAAAASPQQTPQQKSQVALNIGEADDPQQPVIQTAPQVAASEWHGASFPLENFEEYTSPFGYRTAATGGNTTEFHYGLDMAAPQGSYIRNWWSGTVVEVSDDSNCGTSVVVQSDAWTHIYCHMKGSVETNGDSRYMVDREGGIQIREGQQVAAGVRIGRVGMTGRTTGPHLHWGLKYDDNWVDPVLVLRAMYESQQRTARIMD